MSRPLSVFQRQPKKQSQNRSQRRPSVPKNTAARKDREKSTSCVRREGECVFLVIWYGHSCLESLKTQNPLKKSYPSNPAQTNEELGSRADLISYVASLLGGVDGSLTTSPLYRVCIRKSQQQQQQFAPAVADSTPFWFIMASLEEISELLDRKLSEFDNKLGKRLSELLDNKLEKKLSELLDKKLAPLQRTVGSLVETNMRNDAKMMFGNAFAKKFLIRSLHEDAVHLIAKASFKNLTPGAVNERPAAANRLAEKANEFAIPLVEAFCSSFDKKYKTDVNSSKVTDATAALNDGYYHKCLRLLIHASKIGDSTPADVLMHLRDSRKRLQNYWR